MCQQAQQCLSALVLTFIELKCPEIKYVAKFFAQPKSLADAISRACASIHPHAPDGRMIMSYHQRHVGRKKLEHAKFMLLDIQAEIKECNSFYSLHDVINSHLSKNTGIGELTIYDIAERIGQFREIYPEVVYLHADARKGARLLGYNFAQPTLGMDEIHSEISRRLSPAQVESFLCVCKDAIAAIMNA